MKFSTTSVLLAAALGVSAHPSGHVHQRAHNSLQARGDFVMANKPAAAPTSTAAPIATPTPSSAAPAKDATSGGSGSSTAQGFCGKPLSKRATAAEIAYKGNVGGTGALAGCNIMAVQSKFASQYQYTAAFNNAGGDSQCKCWNKIGPDGGINGFFNGNEALTFSLPAGGSQTIAFDGNSQGACACGEGSLPLTSIGEFAATWFEFDFGNLSNGGWSGYDASCLVSAAANLPIPGLKVCLASGSTCSTIYPGGKGDNAFVAGTAAMDGIGGNLTPGDQSLVVTVNYQG
ncbi:hypothetical protein GGI43DRAFT_389827 [Trichoderma evansii]